MGAGGMPGVWSGVRRLSEPKCPVGFPTCGCGPAMHPRGGSGPTHPVRSSEPPSPALLSPLTRLPHPSSGLLFSPWAFALASSLASLPPVSASQPIPTWPPLLTAIFGSLVAPGQRPSPSAWPLRPCVICALCNYPPHPRSPSATANWYLPPNTGTKIKCFAQCPARTTSSGCTCQSDASIGLPAPPSPCSLFLLPASLANSTCFFKINL